MQTLPLFERFTNGFPASGNAKELSAFWRDSLAALPGAAPGTGQAMAASMEALLDGAARLRHMQLDAIHKAQRRTVHLARTLGHDGDPARLMTSLQTYAQDNLNDTLQYWDAYRRIVQDTELHLLTPGDDEPAPRKARASAKRKAA